MFQNISDLLSSAQQRKKFFFSFHNETNADIVYCCFGHLWLWLYGGKKVITVLKQYESAVNDLHFSVNYPFKRVLGQFYYFGVIFWFLFWFYLPLVYTVFIKLDILDISDMSDMPDDQSIFNSLWHLCTEFYKTQIQGSTLWWWTVLYLRLSKEHLPIYPKQLLVSVL